MDLFTPLLPATEKYLICTDTFCWMSPFDFATTPVFWIGWGITVGIIIMKQFITKKKSEEEPEERPEWDWLKRRSTKSTKSDGLDELTKLV